MSPSLRGACTVCGDPLDYRTVHGMHRKCGGGRRFGSLTSTPKPGKCRSCGAEKKTTTGDMCRPCTNREINRNRVQDRSPSRDRPCEACGKPLGRRVGGNDRGRYCSHDCYLSTLNRREPRFPQSRIAVKPCGWCGDLFTAHPVNVAYCSDYCRLSKHIGKAAKRVTDLYSEATRLGFGGQNWRKLLVAALRERDGDLCCLCWSPIDFTIRSGPRGSDHGYSIEHLVPRSESQDDTWTNLALSHWGCNRRRRTQPIDVLWRAS